MSGSRELLSEGLPYEDILRRNAFRYGAYEENVDDILQDVFIAAWEKADDIPTHKLKAYLLTVTRNTSLNRKRQEQVRHKHNSRVQVSEIRRRTLQAPDPEMRVLQNEKTRPTLSDREQELVRLLYDVGLLKQEAAAQLGISPRTVHRWLAKIKEKLSE